MTSRPEPRSRGKSARLLVKVCGITGEEALEAAVEAGADAVGFVLAPSRRRLSLDRAARLCRRVPAGVLRVGVFVDEDPAAVRRAVDECGLDLVQLHGNESPDYCASLGVPHIKAFRPASGEDVDAMSLYRPDYYLVDARHPRLLGGTGTRADWVLARRAAARFPPLILAGGLDPLNVAAALESVRPAGVDVSSGVETGGAKDPAKIAAFVRAAREWERGEDPCYPTGGDTSADTGGGTSPRR